VAAVFVCDPAARTISPAERLRGLYGLTGDTSNPRLSEGFHGYEEDNGSPKPPPPSAITFHDYEEDNGYRWTTGDSKLPAALFADLHGESELVLPAESSAWYVDDGRARAVA
jgi:hypothetical protein